MSVFAGAVEVRLADGGSRCAGRVEVKHQGQWGTVCGHYWSMNDAAVVCKQLGCGSAVGAPKYGEFGEGSGPTWMNNVGCNGTESALSDCTHSGWGEHECEYARDAGVMCSGAVEVRLADGGSRCAGRVEVKQQGKWGTVCGDSWDMNDAAVVCKQLGCGSALEAPQYGHFGPGTGPIWMDDVDCNGTESALSDCTHDGWGENDCSHSHDAGVICSAAPQQHKTHVAMGSVSHVTKGFLMHLPELSGLDQAAKRNTPGPISLNPKCSGCDSAQGPELGSPRSLGQQHFV
ncbi:scavenger receptor cysteine-rich type 1 protein M130-like [Athene noctua]|uniref:scavenger receptor cysteine-rich type 1 protein M130-like n=1 Tax=Athene noctua TaxID=126797 RepID=UPI003EBD870C